MFAPESETQQLPIPDSNLWMMSDDLHNEIWGQFQAIPLRHASNGIESIRLARCTAKLEGVLTKSIPNNQGYDRDLADAIREFVPMIARNIMTDGSVVFELCIGRIPKEHSPTPAAAMLRFIPCESLIRSGRSYFQVIQQRMERGQATRTIQIATEKIVRFAAPTAWEGAVNRLRAELILIGKSMKQWMSESLHRLPTENFSHVKRGYNVALALATSSVGWNARGLFNDHIADFHFMARELRWKRFCIEIRDQIIATLGEAFKKMGGVFGERPELIVDGLLGLSEVDASEARLRAGPTRFDELMKPFR